MTLRRHLFLSALMLAAAQAVTAIAWAEGENEPVDPPGTVYHSGLEEMDPETIQALPVNPAFRAFIPVSTDLSFLLPGPGNQGNAGSCVAWAVGYAARSYYTGAWENRDLSQRKNIPSPNYIYTLGRQIQNKPVCKQGISVASAIAVLKQGAPSLAEYPYHADDCDQPPPASVVAKAGDFRVLGFSLINPKRLDDVKGALAQSNPLIIEFHDSPSFQAFRGAGIYNDTTADKDMWHAIAVVGYDDRKQAFRLINSWGTGWGDHGYGWISYDVFAARVRLVGKLEVARPAIARREPAKPDYAQVEVAQADKVPNPPPAFIAQPAPVPPAPKPPVGEVKPEPQPSPAPAPPPPAPKPRIAEIGQVEVAQQDVVPNPAPPVINMQPVPVPVPAPPAPKPPVTEVKVPEPQPTPVEPPPAPKPQTVEVTPPEPQPEPAPVPAPQPPAPSPRIAEVKPQEIQPVPSPEPPSGKAGFDDLDRLKCARLNLFQHDGHNILSGFVASEADLGLVQRVAADERDTAIGKVMVAPWPQCEILQTLWKPLNQQGIPKIDLGGTSLLHKGDLMRVAIQSPPQITYLYVSYVQADGTVVNLVQPQGVVPGQTKPNQTLIFGDGVDGRPLFEVGAPYGTEMIVAIASRSPLFDASLPPQQTEREYMTALRRALLYKPSPNMPDREVAASIATVETREK